jgi:hypothetical protein
LNRDVGAHVINPTLNRSLINDRSRFRVSLLRCRSSRAAADPAWAAAGVNRVDVRSGRPPIGRPVATSTDSVCTVVVLDAETSPFIDISAAEMLAQLAATLRRDGIELRILRDIGQFRDVMRSAVPEAFHRGVFRTIDEALERSPRPAGPDPTDEQDRPPL